MSNFQIETQEKLNWCWAAVSATVSQYFYPDISLTQVDIANQLMDSTTCGQGEGCDKAEALQDALDAAKTLLNNPLICQVINGSLSFQNVQAQIDSGKPVCARILWGGGPLSHFVMISGYAISQSGEAWVDISDPYFVDSTVPYDLFVSAYLDSGAWVETYLVGQSPEAIVQPAIQNLSSQRAKVFEAGLLQLVQLKRIPAGLQVQKIPEPVYTVDAAALTGDFQLADIAKLVSWRYSASDASGTSVTGEVSDTYPFVLNNLSYGAANAKLDQVKRTLFDLPELQAGGSQLRVLRIPGALVEGYWIKPPSGNGSFLRVGKTFGETLQDSRPAPIDDFLHTLRPVEPIGPSRQRSTK